MSESYKPPISPVQMAERVYSVTGNDMRGATNLSYEIDLSLIRTYCWVARLLGHFREGGPKGPAKEQRQILGTYNTRLQCWNMDPRLVPASDVPLFTGFIAGRADIERQKRLADFFPFIDLKDPQTVGLRQHMEDEVGDLGRKLISDWAVVAGGALASADDQTEFITTLRARVSKPENPEATEAQKQAGQAVIAHRFCLEALNTCVIENRTHAQAQRSHQTFTLAREHEGVWVPDKAYVDRETWQRLKYQPDWLAGLQETQSYSAQYAAFIR